VNLRGRIQAFLHPSALPERLAGGILDRLKALEDDAVRHEIVLKESADQISRHLKRVAAIEQRQDERSGRDSGGLDEVTRRVLEFKLGQRGNG